MTATLLDAAGAQLAELAPPARLAAGTHSFTFDGLGQPDGRYTIVIGAVGARRRHGRHAASSKSGSAVRSGRRRSRRPSSRPNGDGRGDELTVSFQLAHAGDSFAYACCARAPGWRRRSPARSRRGPRASTGTAPSGSARRATALYTAVLEVTDAVGTSQVTLPFTLDRHAPSLKLLSRPLRLRVSEAATVTVRVNGSLRRLAAPRAGSLPLTGIRKRAHARRRRPRRGREQGNAPAPVACCAPATGQ